MAEENTTMQPEETATQAVETTDAGTVTLESMCELLMSAFPEDGLTSPEDCKEKLTWLIDTHKKEQAANKIISDAFESEPRLAAVIRDWASGKRKNFMAALASHIDPSELLPVEGEPTDEEMQSAIAERSAMKESMQSRLLELDNNLEESRKNLEAFMNDKGLDLEKFQPFIDFIDNVHKAFYDGKLTKQEIDMLWKAYNHDGDMENAYTEGKNDGLNTKIVEKKMTKVTTDNMPVMVAASEEGTSIPKKRKEGWAVDWRDNVKK